MIGLMAELLAFSCSMCSYGSRTLETLTLHVCKNHKSDPRFHIYCESCLRSYTNWDSYRKHLQRGCNTIPSTSVHPDTMDPGSPPAADNEIQSQLNMMDISEQSDELTQEDWHEAAYILNIKEKYIISQVAIDQILSCTKILVFDILSGIMDDIQGNLPSNAIQLLQNKVEHINSSLFQRLSSAALQRKYFRQYFNLVVSDMIPCC